MNGSISPAHKSTRHALAGCASVLALAAGCNGSTPTGPAVAPTQTAARPTPPAEPLEVGAPRLCLGAQSLAKLIAQGPLPPVDPSVKEGSLVASLGGAKADPVFASAYKQAAPATVYIQTHRGGYGTGVVIDGEGLVLTNHHVIESGAQDDFTIKVKVYFGELTKTGRMVKQAEAHEGIVVKTDPVRDIALVRLTTKPKKLSVAPLAPKDPKTGQPIAAIGHAGIGLLWAMKTCSVSAVGERQHRAKYQFDCRNLVDPAADNAVNERMKKQCEESQKDAIEQINEMQQGLVLQTDCAIAKGDSGGPVINAKGEVIAINQSMTSDSITSSNVAYHVHVAELREFIHGAGTAAAFFAPDPWCEGGMSTEVTDVDLDGQLDTARATGSFRYAMFYDLDQDSYPGGKAREVKPGQMPFDAEVAILSLPRGTYTWYDRDNDGAFDLVLVDAEDTGKVKRAFTLKKDGSFEPAEAAVGGDYLDAAHLKDAALKGRLGHLATITQPRYASSATLEGATADLIPDPIWGGGRKGDLRDMDRDGTPDVLRVESPFSTGWLVDADQGSLAGKSTEDDPQALINDRKIDAEISVVVQARNFWAMYDRDDDGSFDLALRAPAERGYFAMQAWTHDGKKWTPTAEATGLKVVRPDMLGTPRARSVLRNIWGSEIYATDEGLGLVPDPRPASGYYTSVGADGVDEKSLIRVYAGSGMSLLIDVNQDAKLEGGGLREAVANRSFSPEVMTHTIGESIWVHYDGDADGQVDVVLFSSSSDEGKASAAYRLAGGKLRYDASLVSGPLYRASLLNADLRDSFKKIAAAVFKTQFVE